MFVLVAAAFADNVKLVFVAIAVILPSNVPVSSYNRSPAVNSVKNKVDVPVTVVDPVDDTIVPVRVILAEFATAVICPSKFPSQAVFDTVLRFTVGVDFLSNTVNGTSAVKQPEPEIPGVTGFITVVRVALT